MPEGDTVHRQCRILHEALAGATLTRCELRVPRLADTDLRGWRVREVVPRGKHLLLRLLPPADGAGEPLTLHSHLMMDGIWFVDDKPLISSDTSRARRPAHTARVILEARHDDGRVARATGYEIKQVHLLRTAEEDSEVGHLGPDLLSPAWGPALREQAAANLAAQADLPLGQVLLDQRVMAGVGNIYRSELCFLQRISPFAPVSALSDPGALVDLAHRLLDLNKDRSVRVTTGGMMGRGGDLWVYGRAGQPCRRCRGRVERRMMAQPDVEGAQPRVVFVCPRCQGESR
ncbi:DNA-formamidopyrimidine glycosylase family protein [Brachybacterium hainanense]|uniref:DNA-(apurinic or apyrimidinic site) lyase n=1 Tax=Brachybacterium hainanense TaxID=1541174 RepID=A0ABV6R912_9MICO